MLRFPSVAADAELAVDVIYAEYLAREQSGEKPELAEYEVRFPAFAPVLAEQIRLHHAFDTLEDDDTQVEANEAEPAHRADTVMSPGPSKADASYEILEQIGSGGMGVVYRARQAGLNRFVALKMVRAIDASNRELLARFRSEARVVASLHHPHIVQVYDYGEHEGLPYLTMELVEGGSLADRLDGTPWAPREAAALLIKLADAVQFAHQRHIIHRDLKPANLLVVSDATELEVKITDFGLAKFLVEETSLQTKSNAFLGTPSYMSPEQAHGRAHQIGPATDVYSLGAIFYELLTGQPPLRGESPIETLRLLLSDTPISMHRFDSRIPRDLATICEKCLRREPNRRYASASELSEDLNRYLQGRPIQARPVGNIERAWRWCRRNPLLAGAFGSVAMLLAGIATVSLWYSAQLSRELTKTREVEQAERTANQSAQLHLWDAYMSEATALNSSRQLGQRFAALESIDKATALLGTIGRSPDRELQLRNAVLSSVTLPDMRILRSLGELPAQVNPGAMSAAADCYIAASRDGTLKGYRLSDGHCVWTVEHSDIGVQPVLSRDARFVAATGERGTKVWRIEGSEPRLAWEAAGAQYFTFAPDGEHAAYSTLNEGMRFVRIASGETVRKIGSGPASSKFSFDANSGRIAVCGPANVQVIAGDTGEIECEFPGVGLSQPLTVWHPGGDYLAVWGDLEGIVLWNVEDRTKALTLRHRGMPAQLSFSQDGSILASQSLWDRRLLAWDVGTAQRFLEVHDFVAFAQDAAPDGRILFLTARGGELVLSELTAGACRALAQALHTPLSNWLKVSLSPEGRMVAFSSFRGLELWDLKTTRRLAVRAIGPCSAHFDNSGRIILGCKSGIYRFLRSVNTIETPDADSDAAVKSMGRRTVVRFDAPEQLSGPIVPMSLAVNSSGAALVFQDESDWAVMQLDGAASMTRLIAKHDPRKGAISDDHRYAAIANWEHGGATVWDARSGAALADLGVGQHGIVQFSPDGRLLAATPDGVTVWRASDWRRIHQLGALGTTPTGLGIAFSPDSRVLAVGQVNGALRFVDPLTGADWARLSNRDSSVASNMAFSSDLRWLVTSCVHERSPAQVWDLTSMRRELVERGLDWPADVLRATASPQSFEERLEVLLDGVDVLTSTPLSDVETSNSAHGATSR